MRVVGERCARVSSLRWVGFLLVVLFVVSFAVNTQEDSSALLGAQGALDHAVLLWEASELFPFGASWSGFDLLDVGDIDGDGSLDVVCSHDNEVVIFTGDGKGGFEREGWDHYELEEVENEALPPSFKEFRPIGHFSATAGILIDLDADADLDLVVSGTFRLEEEETVRLYIFGNEKGHLHRASSYDLKQTFTKLWNFSQGGKGSVELLAVQVGRDEEGSYTRLFILPGTGELGFGEPIPLEITVRGWPISFDDVDGDGRKDLAFCERDIGVSFYFGNGEGDFQAGPAFLLGEEKKLHAVSLGDLDGDGLFELVMAIDDQLVVASSDDGCFRERHHDVAVPPSDILLEYLDGDEHLDALLIGPYGQLYTVLPGDGHGGFLGGGSEFVPSRSGYSLFPVDVNTDGRTGFLLKRGYSLGVIVNGGEPWGTSRLPLGGSTLLGSGDLDGNGGRDLIVEGKSDRIDVLWNDGSGAFIRSTIAALPGFEPLSAVVGDGTVSVLGQKFEEGFHPMLPGQTVAEILTFNLRGEEVACYTVAGEGVLPTLLRGDLDGDGVLDLAGGTKRSVWVVWSGEEFCEYPVEADLNLITGLDFNGDGRAEIAANVVSEYADLVLLSFEEREASISDAMLQLEALPLALTAGDLDGDGRSDLVTIAIGLTGEVADEELKVQVSQVFVGMVLSTEGTKTHIIEDFPEEDMPWPFTGLVVGEFTSDERMDVAFSTLSGAGLFILSGNGDGSFGKMIQHLGQVGPLIAADLDGAGQDEIVASTLGFNPVAWILWNGGG
jgi:hypothetical protein